MKRLIHIAIPIYLHNNPELSLMEVNTSGKMANELKRLGFDVITGISGYGVLEIRNEMDINGSDFITLPQNMIT